MTLQKKLQALIICAALTGSIAYGRTYVVSPSGSDHAAGTADAPYKTISKGAEMAQAGDTVYVKAGIYRERVAPLRGGEKGKPIFYQAEPGWKVIIKGSNILKPHWKLASGSIYYGVPDSSLFDDQVYVDDGNPLKVEVSSTPYQRHGKREFERGYGGDKNLMLTIGQVFLNGKWLTQVPYKKELESDKNEHVWYYEKSTDRIYINFLNLKPKDQLIEISTRRRIFAPHARKLGYITVQGFVMEHCGNQYATNFWNTPANAQAGALGFRGGHNWIVRDCVIRHAHSYAIDGGSVDVDNQTNSTGGKVGSRDAHDNLIENCYLIENGAGGVLASQSLRFTIRNNVILRNNMLRFTGKKRWEQGGIKTHAQQDGLIEGNYIAYQILSDGVWLDNHFPDARVTRNVIYKNETKGVFLEMSDYEWDRVMVDNNVILENAWNPIYIHDASGSTSMHNLLANTAPQPKWGQGIVVYQVSARTKTYHHSFFNNMFLNNDKMIDIDYPSHRAGEQRIDYNVYDASPTDRTFRVDRRSDAPKPWSSTDFAELIHKELGPLSPGASAMQSTYTATLTFNEWKAFWKNHEMDIDSHSLLNQGSSVAYDPETHLLTLDISYDPKSVGSKNHKGIDKDFFGSPIPQNNKAITGPFQDLKQGRNVYKIWNGMKIVAEGEMPTPIK